MGKKDLISHLTLSLDIESENINDINKKFYWNIKSPDNEKAQCSDVEIEAFNKFLGVNVELPGYGK